MNSSGFSLIASPSPNISSLVMMSNLSSFSSNSLTKIDLSESDSGESK